MILPMFPLGTVLFPNMPLPLVIFEPRYRRMLTDVLKKVESGQPAEMGVVLIERGAEVGGGELRFDVGTVARLVEVGERPDGTFSVLAFGGRRFRVAQWLPDDPYPVAEVDPLPELVPAADDRIRFEQAEHAVRRAMVLRAQLDEPGWSPDVDLDDDLSVAAWQLAGVAPLEQVDQVALLGATTATGLLDDLARLAEETTAVLAFRLSGG